MSDRKSGIWGSVKGIIGSVAPMVATAIGGPFGGIAATAIRAALGADTDDQAVEALKSNPDALLKLKLAEVEFNRFMRQADIDEHALIVEDRKDARDMAKVLKSVWPQMSIVIMLTSMIAAVIYGLFFTTPPDGSKDVLYMVLGQLSTAWGASIAFFVGTTKSSAEKSAQISELKR